MGTVLVLSLFLVTQLYAGIVTCPTSSLPKADVILPSSTPSPLLDVDEELAKIAAICLNRADFEQLLGNAVTYHHAMLISIVLVGESVASIGLAELRAALGFAPLPPWGPYNGTRPSEAELQSAPTPEAYYDLKEPHSHRRSLNNQYLLEQNVADGIAFLDVRVPAIRAIFRQTFEQKRPKEEALDKKAIDYMLDEYEGLRRRVNKATEEMRSSFWEKCSDFFD